MSLRSRASRAPYGALLALFGTIVAPPRAGMSLAIVPPFVEKIVPAGSKLVDTVAYTNTGDEVVIVSVDFADFGVTENGDVTEQPPGTEPKSLVRNLRVSPMEVRVVPNQQVFFRYSVATPADFTQMRSMLYLSSRPEAVPGANQVQVVARMGVPIYVENIKATPADLRIETLEWERVPDHPDTVLLHLAVVNQGERNIRPAGYVHVLSTDRRFEETFEFNEGREPVLPGQKRRWEQQFGPVPDGELALKLRLTTSDRHSFDAAATLPAADR
ncbi:MAG: hypothetical protein ACE5IK_01990 [Acidobacteriota bacterium]